jgi:hypothetical protein
VHAQLRGEAVVEGPAVRWQRTFRILLDPEASDPQRAIDVPSEQRTLVALRRRLRAEFGADPAIDRIFIRVDGVDIGISTRALANRDPGHADATSPTVDPGSSDGATLPGLPGEFRAIRFVCDGDNCQGTFLRVFFDERTVLSCPDHPDAKVVYQP